MDGDMVDPPEPRDPEPTTDLPDGAAAPTGEPAGDDDEFDAGGLALPGDERVVIAHVQDRLIAQQVALAITKAFEIEIEDKTLQIIKR